MTAITLSRRQAKEADRVGGIELMILWPTDLGPEPQLSDDCEREAKPSEKQRAEALVSAACRAAGLVPVHVRIARVRRPSIEPRRGEWAAHLAVTIIGQRWVHATTKQPPMVMFAAGV